MRGAIVCGGLAHAIAAAAWWWLAPGGFAVDHPRFLAGVALPCVVVVVGLLGAVAAVARQDRLGHAALACWTAMWCSGAATALVLYDDGRFRIALGCAAPCAILLLVCAATSFVGRSRWSWAAGVLGLLGIAVGVAFPFAVRAPVATTRPVGGAPDAVSWPPLLAKRVDLARGVRLDTRTATVTIEDDGIDVSVHPLLRLWSRAPDRGWTLFTRASVRNADQLLILTGQTKGPGSARISARGAATHVMDVSASAPGAARIEAWSDLEHPEYAHQASCAGITTRGLASPKIELSVAEGELFDVLPHDYPFGRPLRFASLLPDGTMHVFQASSGEKGPFITLARGALDRADPLILTLYDGDRPRVRVTLRDFASQASTDLSPTAGWGIPQNDISFTKREPGGEMSIHATWAGTGIGRGFDTVGHASGTYRNRIEVEILR